jgi:hypothetical protein
MSRKHIGTAEQKIADLQADINFDRALSTSLAFRVGVGRDAPNAWPFSIGIGRRATRDARDACPHN